MTRFKSPDGALSMETPLPQNVELWIVYGNPSFPHTMCAKIRSRPGSSAMLFAWTMREYKIGWHDMKEPVYDWAQRHRMAYFFPVQDDALEFVRALTTPG